MKKSIVQIVLMTLLLVAGAALVLADGGEPRHFALHGLAR